MNSHIEDRTSSWREKAYSMKELVRAFVLVQC